MDIFSLISEEFFYSFDFWIILGGMTPVIIVYVVVLFLIIYRMVRDARQRNRTRTISVQTDSDPSPNPNQPILAENFNIPRPSLNQELRRSIKSSSGSNNSSHNKINDLVTPQQAAQRALCNAVSEEELNLAKSSLRKTSRSRSARFTRHRSHPFFASTMKFRERRVAVEMHELLDMSTSSRDKLSIPQLGDKISSKRKKSSLESLPLSETMGNFLEDKTSPVTSKVKTVSNLDETSTLSTAFNASSTKNLDMDKNELPNKVSSSADDGHISQEAAKAPNETSESSNKVSSSAEDGHISREAAKALNETSESTALTSSLWTEIYLGEI